MDHQVEPIFTVLFAASVGQKCKKSELQVFVKSAACAASPRTKETQKNNMKSIDLFAFDIGIPRRPSSLEKYRKKQWKISFLGPV